MEPFKYSLPSVNSITGFEESLKIFIEQIETGKTNGIKHFNILDKIKNVRRQENLVETFPTLAGKDEIHVTDFLVKPFSVSYKNIQTLIEKVYE